MPRPKAFDREQTLRNAMTLFWQNGYQSTSMRMLIEATGVNPGSWYASFGNKEAIFLEVLEVYYHDLTSGINAALKHAESYQKTLQQFFDLLIAQNSRTDVRGCLLVNSLLELAHKPEMQAHISAMFTGFEEMFYWTLLGGQKKGEFNPKLNTRSGAQFLVTSYFGLRAESMMDLSTDDLKARIEQILNFLN